jgi:hypothetical protein
MVSIMQLLERAELTGSLCLSSAPSDSLIYPGPDRRDRLLCMIRNNQHTLRVGQGADPREKFVPIQVSRKRGMLVTANGRK